ncbi:MAG: tetraacyldisaccharide 4'-kinase [Candidatus Edwardsbacteria bacterium]
MRQRIPLFIREKVWANKSLLSFLLLPFSFLYGAIIIFRNWLYEQNIFKSYSFNIPVISVGNITVGGTGKTPFIAYLARFLRDNAKRVVILSRGYKRREYRSSVVSNRERVLVSCQEAGDEPYLLAENLSGVPVMVGRDRVGLARLVREKFQPEIILLDDGFQYRALKRDLDIVLINVNDPFGNKRLFSSGPLREPLKSLKRAHIFILTHSTSQEKIAQLTTELSKYNPEAQVFMAVYQPVKLKEFVSPKEISFEELKIKRLYAFSSIANPLSFRNTLDSLQANIIGWEIFPDHYWYKIEDLPKIEEKAVNSQAEILLTTEKDKVRLPKEWKSKLPCYILGIEIKILSGEKILQKLVLSVCD